MVGQIAIAKALPRFSDLGRLGTPIFLLMDHFLYRFSTFCEKNEENVSIRILNLSQNAPSNRPLPSSPVPLFQSESKCETILMKMTLICMKIKLHAELIFI